ncbi:SpoIID/LytB domain-containing protein [Pleurocapsales cyanobacterium LEGE 06147]|nr:SpoIID/LytB domain-containing protein [Pleurocapsales cyanobacterium LEGE 06147]
MSGRSLGVVLLGCLFGLTTTLATVVQAKEIELQVGIVQRLGEEPIDEKEQPINGLKISSIEGDLLTLNFPGQEQPSKSLQTDSVVLQVQKKPVSEPVLSERLVLSNHATFETAEDSANLWKTLGIEVEITQPERWQVWAKRDVYRTPLTRRWLLQSLQANGYTTPYLETEVLTEVPQLVLLVKGKRYYPEEVEITASKNAVAVGIPNNPESTKLYGGSLRLQPNAYGNFTLVNQVPLETYLRGVVPHEIGANAPAKAVEAQTIIARTYALRNLRRFAADDYQLCATVHCQVYEGLKGTTPQSDRAIAATKGLVLTYQKELVDALYSSTTGGVTASFSDAWNGVERPYLKPRIDSPYPVWDLSRYSLADEATFRRFISLKQGFNETGRGVFRWHKESKIEDLNRDLRKYLKRTNHPLADFETIEQMKVKERSPSGRILTLSVKTDKGVVELHKNEVRSAFEPPRSTLFYLEPIYDESKQLTAYAFIGGGFGHGVGLSQYGSYHLAKLGWSAEQILAFYYPETTIEPLNESIVLWREPHTPLPSSTSSIGEAKESALVESLLPQ